DPSLIGSKEFRTLAPAVQVRLSGCLNGFYHPRWSRFRGAGQSPKSAGPPVIRRKCRQDVRKVGSHFVFGPNFAEYLERERSEKLYPGPCAAVWLFWDIDRADDLDAALRDARRLAAGIHDRYRELGDDELLAFLSGGKGFHIGIPTSLWRPSPSP